MKYKKDSNWKFLISLIVIFLISALSAEAQFVQWTKTYGSPGYDGSQSSVISNDGGIVIAGFKGTIAWGYKDVLLMKTDASGNEIWSRMYNLNLNDIARCVQQTSDGGYIITGMTEVGAQVHDPFLIKTDSSGNMQWVSQYDYGFGLDDRGHAVGQTSDGGYIIAGQTIQFHGGFSNYDMYIVKTDINGNVQWKKIFYRQEHGADVALSVQQLADGGYIIGGMTLSSPWSSYIIRTDSAGNAVWSNIYPGSWQSECYDILALPDGGFIFTGTESSHETDTDVLIMKLDSLGNIVWKKIYGTIEAEDGRSIKRLPDGGYIIAGVSTGGAGSYDMYVIRTNSSGDSLWSATIGGTGDDRAYSVDFSQNGTYYISGWAWSYGLGQGDVYLVKMTESVTATNGNNNEIPDKFYLSQNYPNPFNPVTSIKFGVSKAQNVELVIYDAAGRIIDKLASGKYNAGTYEIRWDASKYSSGVYFYTLKSGEFSVTKKMLLVK